MFITNSKTQSTLRKLKLICWVKTRVRIQHNTHGIATLNAIKDSCVSINFF